MGFFGVFNGDKAFLTDIDELGGVGAPKSGSKLFTGSLLTATAVFL